MAGYCLPQQRIDDDWYLGTANAVYQNIYSIKESGAEDLLILAADHIYKMSIERDAELRRAILDKGALVRLGARVGFDPGLDRRRGFVLSAGGITCVPKGTVV